MSVWLTIPSARTPEQVEPVLKRWKEMGYKIALWRESFVPLRFADLAMGRAIYPGYAIAVNSMIQAIIEEEPNAEWFIAAGDDTLPDPTKRAEDIAEEVSRYFSGLWLPKQAREPHHTPYRVCAPTFGVMQPTGDPWRDVQGRIIERIAGSAWLGREFCKRINHGQGPLWHEYTHCFVDEELQCVAQKYGVFWQRPDLIHHHDHWARKSGNIKDMPAFLKEANSAAHWHKYSKLFNVRKALGFPGSEPL